MKRVDNCISSNSSLSLSLYLLLAEPPKPHHNPCIPSPCGPYSECRQIDNHAVCSCQKEYIGTPPACRPECMVSSECALNRACINKKCVDPCPGTCGPEARCQVVNHNAICSCPPGFSGDPFLRCFKERKHFICVLPLHCSIFKKCKKILYYTFYECGDGFNLTLTLLLIQHNR